MKLIKCPRCESNIFGKVSYCPCCNFIIDKSRIRYKYDIEIEEKYCHICGCCNKVYLCKGNSTKEKIIGKLFSLASYLIVKITFVFSSK